MGTIRYCGNCNPETEPKKVRGTLKKMAAETGDDVLILVNGCPRLCLTKRTTVSSQQKVISLLVVDLLLDGIRSQKEP